MSNTVIFVTQVASILGFVGLMFGLYRLLVATKNATIELLKEKVASLQSDLASAHSTEPDVLVERYASRLNYLTEELRRLSTDQDASAAEIEEKEAELERMNDQVSELRDLVDRAQEVMGDFLCPHCGAVLSTREYHCVSYEEGDIDHECTTYECGLVIVDGKETSPCPVNRADEASLDVREV